MKNGILGAAAFNPRKAETVEEGKATLVEMLGLNGDAPLADVLNATTEKLKGKAKAASLAVAALAKPPSPKLTKRQKLIGRARREYRNSPHAAGQCSESSWVDQSLRNAAMGVLDKSEKGKLVAAQDDDLIADTQGGLVIKPASEETTLMVRGRLALGVDEGTSDLEVLRMLVEQAEENAA